ncbi:hypothetical protein U8527_13465 [Kordia algicida OT-1]|uniref:hypothetical protein n=1 Tax=Kordia algicida TaxID=221066 RepID=UPI0012F91DCB|nr:hypothetical protein [Kordia algicida]
MKKRKLTSLSLKKKTVSSLNQTIVGGSDKTDFFTQTCARPIGNCTIALTVQPAVCNIYSQLYRCNSLVKC